MNREKFQEGKNLLGKALMELFYNQCVKLGNETEDAIKKCDTF